MEFKRQHSYNSLVSSEAVIKVFSQLVSGKL